MGSAVAWSVGHGYTDRSVCDRTERLERSFERIEDARGGCVSATKSTPRQPALRAKRQRRAPPWLVPLESKLHVPAPRAGLVLRPRLLEQLAEADGSPLILVTAPPGYGKTTLLAQWAAADGRPFVWVTLDATDND